MKKEGDSIKPGDILAQIETDKATVDFEMQEEGFIAKLLFPEGAKDVKLGTVVAIVVDSLDDVAKFKDFSGGDAPKTAVPAAPAAPMPAGAPAGGMSGPSFGPGEHPLNAPTARPDEPITAGLSTGPGVGPEAIFPKEGKEFSDDPKTAMLVAMLERAVDVGEASRATRNFVRKLRANQPVRR